MKFIEDLLNSTDFSRFSKVQNSLKQDLMSKYDNMNTSISILDNELMDDELDMVAAAGTLGRSDGSPFGRMDH